MKIAILGFGKEGKSGLNYFKNLGYSDITILEKDLEKKEELEQIGEKFTLGSNYLNNLEKYDLIFKSPGISPYSKELFTVKEKLITSSDIFFRDYKGKVIGVTATKGKSTTSTLIFKMLEKAGYKTKLVGNIGNPILDQNIIGNEKDYDFIVYELSSYMLEGAKPNLFIGVLGNLSPCHIDWHNNSFEVYKNAKLNIFSGAENIIINKDFEELANSFSPKEKITFGKNGNISFDEDYFYIFGEKSISSDGIKLLGEHNKRNISSALGVAKIIGDKSLENALHEVLKEFTGLPHRTQSIGIFHGIEFIDDSISTTPESTIEAIKTFDPNIGTLLLGGQDSGFSEESFQKLFDATQKSNISNLVLFPDTGYKILGDFSKNLKIGEEKEFIFPNGKKVLVGMFDNMNSAVEFSYKNTKKGQKVILSSAAPSFSLWKNYIDKAEKFIYAVKNYSEK